MIRLLILVSALLLTTTLSLTSYKYQFSTGSSSTYAPNYPLGSLVEDYTVKITINAPGGTISPGDFTTLSITGSPSGSTLACTDSILSPGTFERTCAVSAS